MTGVQFLVGEMLGFFLFATAPRPALGPTQVLTIGVKRPGLEADHSLPSSAGVKNV